ncbi:lyase family protein [Microbacterium sp. Marseille-Q6965]|uniref:lyase family protein n=1 Tax=Microbacterium sp. Marseille-Q6965 TaxID=2965072 RepID=UPI0021B72B7F|nr:lyase family protein [Microbacterium sp. Marseille-Q6965]
MPTADSAAGASTPGGFGTSPGSVAPGDAFDTGLLNPVAAGRDGRVSDAAFARALVAAEVALVRAYAAAGIAPAEAAAGATALFDVPIDLASLARDAVAGGNPVIPLVRTLRSGAPDAVRPWVHRGATSQDIVDTAMMLVARDAAPAIHGDLVRVSRALTAFALAHRDLVAAGRTLTQHAVPTTIGLRAATWDRAVQRASERLRAGTDALFAQWGGAGGTLAATVQDVGAEAASAVRSAYARELGLGELEAPWHAYRWPVTEFGDTLVQVVDALGKFATDVATASRTEIAELSEPTGGGSSAMPQKQNPARSVLIRSAAIRAPQLAATLHLAAGLFSDERADGAWHAEWPAMRELMRLALGAASHAADLAEGLRVDAAAVAENLRATDGLIVSERLGAVLGKERAAEIVAAVASGADLRALLAEAGQDPDELLDPARYTGLAGAFVDALGTLPEAAPPGSPDGVGGT